MIVLVVDATTIRSGENRPTDKSRIPAPARREIKSVELETARIEPEALNRAEPATLDRLIEVRWPGS